MEQRARAKTPGMNPQSFKASAINLTAGGSNIERQDTFSAAPRPPRSGGGAAVIWELFSEAGAEEHATR